MNEVGNSLIQLTDKEISLLKEVMENAAKSKSTSALSPEIVAALNDIRKKLETQKGESADVRSARIILKALSSISNYAVIGAAVGISIGSVIGSIIFPSLGTLVGAAFGAIAYKAEKMRQFEAAKKEIERLEEAKMKQEKSERNIGSKQEGGN